jgi:hypothetical protein
LIGLPDVPPDPVLRVEAALLSEAPCEKRPEHPTPKLLTDNLDNLGNRGDRHRLSIPSTPQDKATVTLSLAPALPYSKVTEVIEVTEADRRREPRKSILRSLICALVPNADRQDETVDAKADSRSKTRGDDPL